MSRTPDLSVQLRKNAQMLQKLQASGVGHSHYSGRCAVAAVLTLVIYGASKMLFRRRIAKQSLQRRYEESAGKIDQCAHAGFWNTVANHAKPAWWRTLSSILLCLLSSSVALLKESIFGNVQFANHYSIITGSSRKSPKTRTVITTSAGVVTTASGHGRRALRMQIKGTSIDGLSMRCGDMPGRGWCTSSRPPKSRAKAAAAAFMTLDLNRMFGQVRQLLVFREAHEPPRGCFEIHIRFLLLDEILVYRVTRNSHVGVLRGTPADGVLASPAVSALAPAALRANSDIVLHTTNVNYPDMRNR